MSNNNLREWSARLEAGEQGDELLALAVRLERAARNEPSTIPLDYRRQLRRDLLNRYPAVQAVGRRWRLAQTLAAVGGLAIIVILTWFTMSSVQRPSFGGAPTTEGSITPFYIAPAPVMAAALGSYSVNAPDGLEAGRTLELLAYWHIPDDLGVVGAFAQLLDDAGQVVAQSDGPLKDMGGEAFEVNLAIPLPDPLSNGGYTLIFGLSDATGARLPLYDFVQSAVVYEETSSPLIVGLMGPAGGTVTEAAITPAAAYAYLDHALTGGLLLEMVESEGATETQAFLMPGAALALVVNWRLPPDAPPLSAFAHLLDETGAVVAQSDAPLSADDSTAPQRFTSSFQLPIPEALPLGRYQLIAGLYDPANGGRVPVVGPQGEATQLVLEEYEVLSPDVEPLSSEEQVALDDLRSLDEPFRLSLEDGDALDVRQVTPAAGTVLTGTAPLRFTVTLDHALSSLPQAFLEVRVVEVDGENGRGVGLATFDPVFQGVGRTTVEILVNTSELLGPTELGLWLQLKPDAASAPILIEMPPAYRWRYEP